MDAAREQAFSLLRQQLQGWEHTFHGAPAARISSGCPEFDRFLPQSGFCAGQLVEWLGARASGAETLALLVARQAALLNGTQAIVIVDVDRDFYPPAAVAWGLDLQRLIVIRPSVPNLNTNKPTGNSEKHRGKSRKNGDNPRTQQISLHPDLLWALDQSLRCPAVAAVWSRLPSIDPRDFRRLQLAAEEGNTLGLLLRDPSVRGQPSWSDLQLLVTARPGTGSFFGAKDTQSEPGLPPPKDMQTVSFPATGAPKYVPVPFTQPPALPTTSRRCLVRLIRSRHGSTGSCIELRIQETSRRIEAVQPISSSAISTLATITENRSA